MVRISLVSSYPGFKLLDTYAKDGVSSCPGFELPRLYCT